jgi:hypothetical protein
LTPLYIFFYSQGDIRTEFEAELAREAEAAARRQEEEERQSRELAARLAAEEQRAVTLRNNQTLKGRRVWLWQVIR